MELSTLPLELLDAQPSWWREAMTQSCRDGVGGWSTLMVGGSLSRSYRKMHFSDPESSHSSRISASGEGT